MNKHWYMLTVVGIDRSGIVASTTEALNKLGCNLGEASMMRLGANFTIMLMVQCDCDIEELNVTLHKVAMQLDLQFHLDKIGGGLHDHRIPDVRVRVHGSDRPGIVSQVTRVLANAGLDICDLESDVIGDDKKPVYIMTIEGHAGQGIAALETALKQFDGNTIQVNLEAIDVMIG